MYAKIDHVGIAVRSLSEALRVYESVFGFRKMKIEEVAGQETRVALLSCGRSRVELLEPMADNSPVGRFLERRGEGLHHICFQVDDIQAEMTRLRAAGVRLIDGAPRQGANGCLVAFVHPSSTAGVLVELSQHANSPRNHPKNRRLWKK